jgi:hypothetical protein
MVLLPAQKNQACWLVFSVSHRAVQAMGSAYTGAPVSLVFQGEGSRSCSGWGSTELQVPVCSGKQDLPLSMLSNGA